MTLPSSATQGDEVSVIDYAGTAHTNNLTIGRNSHKIQGSAADLTVSIESWFYIGLRRLDSRLAIRG